MIFIFNAFIDRQFIAIIYLLAARANEAR